MVIDYCQGGELFFHIHNRNGFAEKKAAFYIAEILLALEFLHSKGILYRDLKPENVLVDKDGHICLADFGLSKLGFLEDQRAFSFCGTPEYLAPEIILRAGHNTSVDYWCLGILLYEMLCGSPPYESECRQTLFKKITSKPVKPKSGFSKNAKDLITALTRINPADRLTDPEIIKQHAFFNDIDWVKLINKQVQPPIVPKIRNSVDVSNFEKKMTKQKPVDSLVDSSLSVRTKQELKYQGFTYTDKSIL
jgi:serine/threonine protein kinase